VRGVDGAGERLKGLEYQGFGSVGKVFGVSDGCRNARSDVHGNMSMSALKASSTHGKHVRGNMSTGIS